MTLGDFDELADDRLAREQLTYTFPAVPLRIIASVFAAFRRASPTVAEAIRAAERRLDDARTMVISSVGSHMDDGVTSVAIYLTQHDVDRLQSGLPVDLDAPDHNGGLLLVHVRREREQRLRACNDSLRSPARKSGLHGVTSPAV